MCFICSFAVCEKVESKGRTTYNEVSDLLFLSAHIFLLWCHHVCRSHGFYFFWTKTSKFRSWSLHTAYVNSLFLSMCLPFALSLKIQSIIQKEVRHVHCIYLAINHKASLFMWSTWFHPCSPVSVLWLWIWGFFILLLILIKLAYLVSWFGGMTLETNLRVICNTTISDLIVMKLLICDIHHIDHCNPYHTQILLHFKLTPCLSIYACWYLEFLKIVKTILFRSCAKNDV